MSTSTKIFKTKGIGRAKGLHHLPLLILLSMLAACSGGDVTAPVAGGSGGSGGSIIPPTNNLTMSAITFGVNPLSAYGTTSVSLTVLNNGVPYTNPVDVNFSSTCASSGKATLTPTVTTVNGLASTSYLDNGCAGTDIVVASVTNGPSASITLVVNAPDSGALTFVSATPTIIALRGTGGAGSSEFSRVVFKIVDSAGNPIGDKTIQFSLNTTIGGITLSTPSATSAAGTGLASVDVQAGTVGTPVRVTATNVTGGVILSTQSSALVISTGLPDQNSTSISVKTFNIEGFNYDGVTTEVTMRLADHFNNPVPDDTAVFFTTEGGSITSNCLTKNGACTVTLTSQAPRPTNGRITILAYAVGEESFNDLDGDGLADLVPDETVMDMAEAWRDDNYDGIKDPAETFLDFNNNNIYDVADGKFNAILCNEIPDPLTPTRVSSAGSCSAQKTIHVRKDIELVFSGSFASVSPASISQTSCAAYEQKTITITDTNGNPMPAGTEIRLNSSGALRPPNFINYSFSVANGTWLGPSTTDFTFVTTGDSGCDAGKTGTISVEVTTPLGQVTNYIIGTIALGL